MPNGRKHASVLDYWLSIRGDKEFPPLHDFDPLQLSDAGQSSVLLELIGGGDDAEIRHLGEALKADGMVERIIDAPNPSVLSSIARKLPIVAISRDFLAFEDNFTDANGSTRCWVTLLPLSSSGAWVDYVYAFVSSRRPRLPCRSPMADSRRMRRKTRGWKPAHGWRRDGFAPTTLKRPPVLVPAEAEQPEEVPEEVVSEEEGEPAEAPTLRISKRPKAPRTLSRRNPWPKPRPAPSLPAVARLHRIRRAFHPERRRSSRSCRLSSCAVPLPEPAAIEPAGSRRTSQHRAIRHSTAIRFQSTKSRKRPAGESAEPWRTNSPRSGPWPMRPG